MDPISILHELILCFDDIMLATLQSVLKIFSPHGAGRPSIVRTFLNRKRALPTFDMACTFLLLGCLTLGCATTDSVTESVTETVQEISNPASGALESSADYRTGDIREINIPGTSVSFQLVYVSGGNYPVGTEADEVGREEDEGPLVEVALSGYWIGRYEVTDTEYSVFRYPDRDADTTAVEGAVYKVDAVSRPSPPYEDPAFGLGGPSKPAVGMTQWGAMHYAKWLSEKTGVFFRLPTEAEWETACRAGTDTAYSFGPTSSSIESFGWLASNSGLELHDVGSKSGNDWGIFDMHGNAAEWMLDEYVELYHTEISQMAEADPWIRPTRLHPRTVRGGAFDDPADALRCGARLKSTTSWKRRDPQIPKSFWWNTDSPFLGFRLVAPEQAPSPEWQAEFWTLILGE